MSLASWKSVDFGSVLSDNDGMKTILKWFGLVVVAVGFAVGGYVVWAKQAEREARDARHAALLAAEPWRDADSWRGMTVYSKVSAPHPVWTLFENDPPVPRNRKVLVNKLSRTGSGCRLIGWHASIDSVTPYGDGWETVVTIQLILSGRAHTTSTAVETWRISKDGKAHCVICETDNRGIMFD